MLQDWRKEINRVLVLLTLATAVGWLLDALLPTLLTVVFAYLVRTLYQLWRLHRWLKSVAADGTEPPPEARGLWGDIFDGIYRVQQRARQATESLQSTLDKAQQSAAALELAVVLIDRQGTLNWWNQAGEELLGLRYPTDRYQSVTNLIRDPRFSDYFHSGKHTEPLQLNSPKDNGAMLEFQLTLFGEGERLMVVRDITQLHRLEVMRTDFVANVSHELRTPITVISGYLETLTENLDQFAPRWRKPLEQMLQQSRRMEAIVRDLLLLSRLETKALTRQQSLVDLEALLSEIRNDTLLAFQDKGHDLQVQCDAGLLLKGDRSELYSALSNLSFNAAKYTPNGGRIQIEAQLDDTALRVSVTDNGIGVEEQHIPRLTERFYRVDASRASHSGGTGLGLAIVKHVLMRHGGTLEILSQPGKGSRFTCVFPPQRASRAVPSPRAASH